MTKLEKNAIKLIHILNKAGFTAFFAGGYVRDKILNRKISDIDIVTNAKPAEIKMVLDKSKIKHIEIGEQFGVIAAVMNAPRLSSTALLSKRVAFGPTFGFELRSRSSCRGKALESGTSRSGQKSELSQIFEIATFREDQGIGDSRHPRKVRLNVSPEEDAQRRDFTINGLFLQISNKYPISNIQYPITIQHKWGAVIDYIGGLEDLRKRIIRFIGNPDERIHEDALRMIRAIRFAVQLGFVIEEKSFQAIARNKELVKKISAERIRDELNKILTSDNPRKGIELLDKTGIFKIIIPEFEKTKTTPQPPNMHLEGSVWNHTLLSLEKMKSPSDPIFAWAVFLHDLAKAYTITTPEEHGEDRIRFSGHDSEGAKMAEAIMKRLKFSNEEIGKVSWLVKFHMLFANLFKMRGARRIRYLKHPYFADLLELFWVDANSSIRSNKYGNPLPPHLGAYERAKRVFEIESKRKPLPKPIINGFDIMKLLGIKSGNKMVGEIMEELYDMQLEKKFKTKKEGLKMAGKLVKKK